MRPTTAKPRRVNPSPLAESASPPVEDRATLWTRYLNQAEQRGLEWLKNIKRSDETVMFAGTCCEPMCQETVRWRIRLGGETFMACDAHKRQFDSESLDPVTLDVRIDKL